MAKTELVLHAVVKQTGMSQFQAWCESCQDGVNMSLRSKADDWADGHNAWHARREQENEHLQRLADLRKKKEEIRGGND